MSGLKKIGELDLNDRRALIEPQNPHFSTRQQSALLSLHRSGMYYKPVQSDAEDLRLMRAIDEEYLKHPYYGRRRMTLAMRARGFVVGPKKISSAPAKTKYALKFFDPIKKNANMSFSLNGGVICVFGICFFLLFSVLF